MFSDIFLKETKTLNFCPTAGIELWTAPHYAENLASDKNKNTPLQKNKRPSEQYRKLCIR